MITATKIRIYPNIAQQEELSKAFGCVRFVWNNSLAESIRTYKETGKGLSHFDLNNRLPQLKKDYPWLTEPYSQVLQSTCSNLSRAYANFFKKRTKFPKFKSKDGKQSIHYPQNTKIIGDKIHFPKIGLVKAVIHREIHGKIKTVTVSKNPSGKYFASILSETADVVPSASFDGKVLGIDLGLTNLLITSDGQKFDNPRHISRAKKNLKRKQQSLSRKKKGSRNRNKARILVAKAHEKTANARRDYLHKLSRRLVDENQVIAVEDLHVKGMMKNSNLAKSIGDASWGTLVNFLEYKAQRAGKGFIKVDRFFPSSKICSCCGSMHEKLSLDIREWTCNSCGAEHDRDINASVNVKNETIKIIAAGTAVTANGVTVSQERGRKSPILARACEVRSSVLLGLGSSHIFSRDT